MSNLDDSGMMGLRDTQRRVIGWEKHFQTAMMALIVVVCTFIGNSILSLNKEVSQMVVENRNLTLQIARVEGQIVAMQSNYIPRNEFQAYLDRMRALEERRK